MREKCSVGFTLMTVIRSARSWGAKLLHSSRTEGLEHLACAVAGCGGHEGESRKTMHEHF
jgi:hypothetical protein